MEYAKSATYYEKAAAQKPDFPDSLVALGASQLAANKLEDAIATYKKLIPLKPDDTNVRFNFGTALGKCRVDAHSFAVTGGGSLKFPCVEHTITWGWLCSASTMPSPLKRSLPRRIAWTRA